MKSILIEKIIQTESIGETTVLQQTGMIYSFLNPVSYLDALKHKELFSKMDGLFADGSILVVAISLLYGVKVSRCSFDMTSLAPKLLSFATENRKSVYIVASKQDQVERAVDIFRERYENINIIGYRNGYFADDFEKEKEAIYISKLNPDFLIVGMGAIVQEDFLLRVKEAGYQGIGFTCGGFIHQTSKDMIDYYPSWVDRYNLRFLYRMWREPHTRKRYLKAGFLFPVKFFLERVFG